MATVGRQLSDSSPGQADFEKAIVETEAQRAPLAEAISNAMVPLTHTVQITKPRRDTERRENPDVR